MLSIFISSQVYSTELGIGIPVNDDTRTVHLTIKTSDTLRVEPFIGMSSSSGDGITTDYSKIGVGVYAVSSDESSSTLLYYGGRLTIDRYSKTDDYSSSGQEIAPVIGFEYLFSKRFSIGGEAFYGIKSEKYSPDRGDNYTENSSFSGSQVLVRYYFN